MTIEIKYRFTSATLFTSNSAIDLAGAVKDAPGLRVTADKWDENWQEECAGGIHFYISRAEAENH